MIMCVLLCYPVSVHMSQLLSTGCPISSLKLYLSDFFHSVSKIYFYSCDNKCHIFQGI